MSKLGICRTCDGQVAKSAKACPHCGQRKPYRPPSDRIAIIVLASVLGFFCLEVIFFHPGTVQSNGVQVDIPIPASQPAAPSTVENVQTLEDKKALLIEQAKNQVRGLLKDPGSATFSHVVFFKSPLGEVVCGLVNSKNSFGGYGGNQRFVSNGVNVSAIEEQVTDFNKVWRRACHDKK